MKKNKFNLNKHLDMKRIIFITTFLFSVVVFAQPGTIDLAFNPNQGADYPVYTTSIQSDGKIIIGGNFTSFNGTVRNKIARLNTNGTLDANFNPGTGADGYVYTAPIQSDGKIIIGGGFTSYNGIARKYIARLNTDGTLDATFTPGTGPNGSVYTTSIQSNGKIIIAGSFGVFSGTVRKNIGRLNTDGTLDTSFDPGIAAGDNGGVLTNSIQSDGKIIIGGSFTPNLIARLNIDGTQDATFNPGTGANGTVLTTSIQSDGKIIIGGQFTTYNGIAINYIARLNTDGTLDTTFNHGTGASDHVRTTSIQSDGKIIIGGNFTSYNGNARNYIARLNTDGTLDANFNPGPGSDNDVRTTSIQSDGKIVIGGYFTSYNGTGRNRIARINGDNALNSIGSENNILNIYPNPSSGVYTLQTNEINNAKTISIYTILGQKIYDTVISSNETTIDISNQPKGVYLYKVFGENGEAKSGKLVIE